MGGLGLASCGGQGGTEGVVFGGGIVLVGVLRFWRWRWSFRKRGWGRGGAYCPAPFVGGVAGCGGAGGRGLRLGNGFLGFLLALSFGEEVRR